MTTLNAAEYLGIKELGAIAPGKFADIVMLKDFKKFVVSDVILGGKLIVKDRRYIYDFSSRFKYPVKAYRTINIKKLKSPTELLMEVNVHNGVAEVIAIRVTPGKTITKKDKALV